jgi:hypothetical protein
MRRVWIALVAGLSLGQTPGVTPVPPPQDPSIRDPAAEALEDAYEEAAEQAAGVTPPAGFVIQQPLDRGAQPVLVPALPEGSAPIGAGEVAEQEAARVYQPIPSPLEQLEQEAAATGGSDEATGTDTTGAADPTTGTGATTGTPSQEATGGAGAAGTGGQPSPIQQELDQLRTRVQQLETELRARDEQLALNNQAVQQHIGTFQQRAVDVEQARQQRLTQIQTAGQWLLAADQALEIGELGVDNALALADRAFADVRAGAAQDGQGSVIVHADRARALIHRAREAASNRDVYGARLALQDAGLELRLAREASLPRQGTGNVLLTP